MVAQSQAPVSVDNKIETQTIKFAILTLRLNLLGVSATLAETDFLTSDQFELPIRIYNKTTQLRIFMISLSPEDK